MLYRVSCQCKIVISRKMYIRWLRNPGPEWCFTWTRNLMRSSWSWSWSCCETASRFMLPKARKNKCISNVRVCRWYKYTVHMYGGTGIQFTTTWRISRNTEKVSFVFSLSLLSFTQRKKNHTGRLKKLLVIDLRLLFCTSMALVYDPFIIRRWYVSLLAVWFQVHCTRVSINLSLLLI